MDSRLLLISLDETERDYLLKLITKEVKPLAELSQGDHWIVSPAVLKEDADTQRKIASLIVILEKLKSTA